MTRPALHLTRSIAAVGGMALLLAAALPSQAVIVDSADDSVNESAPAWLPEFDHVIARGTSYVFVGYGWVLTAAHSATHEIYHEGIWYCPVPGTEVVFDNGDGTEADLKAFQLQGIPGDPLCDHESLPPLAPLQIADTKPAVDTEVALAGRGKNRGAQIMGAACAPGTSPCGWYWGTGGTIRWGQNVVEPDNLSVFPQPIVASGSTGTYSSYHFFTVFTKGEPDAFAESQVTQGDSGGAVFAPTPEDPGVYELAGISILRSGFEGEARYGDVSVAVDLAWYHDDIIAVIRPECMNGVDDDADGQVDYPADPGCHHMEGESEVADCDDGLDNDGDGFIDYGVLGDPGCRNLQESSQEDPQCEDGIDNDADTFIDHPADPHCDAKTDDSEAAMPGCGLGAELAPLLVAIFALPAGRRRYSKSTA